jgi:hypothetical protein
MPSKKTGRSNFIKDLLLKIDKNRKIQADANKFIIHKNLAPYKFNKKAANVTEDDLPTATILGSSYLIKNNNIIEIYAWCNPSHSLYLQINIMRPAWMGAITIINIETGDPYNIEYLLNNCNKFNDPDNLQYMIVHFINEGFVLFINKATN